MTKPIFVVFMSEFGETRHIITTPECEQDVVNKYKKINVDILCKENYLRQEIFDPQIEVNVETTTVRLDPNIEDFYEFPEDRLKNILA